MALLYAYAFALVLRYRLVAPLLQASRHRLRVREVIREADGVVRVMIGGRHLDELEAAAGQFFRWRYLAAGTWREAHPFSLSAPTLDRYMHVTVGTPTERATFASNLRDVWAEVGAASTRK